MGSVFDNPVFIAAVAAGTIAQILKVIITLATERRLALGRFFETGGMPSSHSAAVTALTVSIGMKYGWNNPLFAISAVFGYIVMYDAAGVRQAAGKHAELINELVVELEHILTDGFQPKTLKTLLGHTLPQVFIGATLGLLVALLVIEKYAALPIN